MTTTTELSPLLLNLPDSTRLLESAATAEKDRRWLTPEGIYVDGFVTDRQRRDTNDPLALDRFVGSTIERYRTEHRAEVRWLIRIDISGAADGRLARLQLSSSVGEKLELAIVGLTTSDGGLALVQIAWPQIADEALSPKVAAIGKSIRLENGMFGKKSSR